MIKSVKLSSWASTVISTALIGVANEYEKLVVSGKSKFKESHKAAIKESRALAKLFEAIDMSCKDYDLEITVIQKEPQK